MSKEAVGIIRAERYGDKIKIVCWDKENDRRYVAVFNLDALAEMPDMTTYGLSIDDR